MHCVNKLRKTSAEKKKKNAKRKKRNDANMKNTCGVVAYPWSLLREEEKVEENVLLFETTIKIVMDREMKITEEATYAIVMQGLLRRKRKAAFRGWTLIPKATKIPAMICLPKRMFANNKVD
jgi:hypothetical protein